MVYCEMNNEKHKMQIYMAPMEGMTGYVFRNVYRKYFHNIDRYFTPFITSVGMSHREEKDVAPENNVGMDVVPQALMNHVDDFIGLATKLQGLGYQTINLNLGCPSGTVVNKGRGAGFLKYPEELLRFLDAVFTQCPIQISVKTRIGVEETAEWPRLLAIYNRFPMEELIIHPRLQKDYYKAPVHLDVFEETLEHCKMPVCYNGDLFTPEQFEAFCERFPTVDRVMFGRGVFRNPGLVDLCLGGEGASYETIQNMFEELCDNYRQDIGSDTPALYKMKEIWTYYEQNFQDPRLAKGIKKAKHLADYKTAEKMVFTQLRNVEKQSKTLK